MGLFSRDDNTEPATVPARAVAYNTPRPLTASAARINLKNIAEMEQLKKRREGARWQSEAWDFYDLVGEIQFSANLIANVASRIRLFPGFITSADTAPSNIFDMKDEDASPELKQAAVETLRKLAHGPGGIPGILRDASLNLFIAGECYLTREPAPIGSLGPHDEVWQIRSVNEVIIRDGRNKAKDVYLKSSRYDSEADLQRMGTTDDFYFNRIWRQHPRYSADADSSLRPQLENCDMVLLYDRSKRGITKSRMNAGMIFVPDGLSAAHDVAEDEVVDLDENPELAQQLDEDTFEEELIAGLTEPIVDETSAASVVPTLVRGPGELGEKIRYITFERKFDPMISSDAERTLERILAGLDLPKDVVSGVGSAKYANAVVIEESLYKAHIEPMILTIVDALTVLLMRPVLKTMGFSDDEIARVVVWYDPSAITTKPDKATAATTGYEAGIISAEAWRRANGFSESDAPSGLEELQRLAKAKGLLNETVTEQALKTIYPELFDSLRQQSVESTDPATQDAIDQALGGAEVQAPPVEGEEPPAAPAAQPPTQLLEP